MRLTKLINLQAFKDLDDLENCAKRRRSRLIHCCFFFILPLYQQLNQKGAATFRGRLAKIRNKNDLECWANGRFPAKPSALGASAWLSWHRNCPSRSRVSPTGPTREGCRYRFRGELLTTRRKTLITESNQTQMPRAKSLSQATERTISVKIHYF